MKIKKKNKQKMFNFIFLWVKKNNEWVWNF